MQQLMTYAESQLLALLDKLGLRWKTVTGLSLAAISLAIEATGKLPPDVTKYGFNIGCAIAGVGVVHKVLANQNAGTSK